MKSRYRVTAIAVLLLAAVGFAPQAEAVSKPPMSTTNATVTADAADQPGRVAYVTLLSTGFEPGQGFVIAALEPQQGWVASGVNAAWAGVSGANAHSGTQHQRLTNDALVPVNTQRVVLSPLVAGVLPSTPSTTTQWINISNDQGADYDVFGQAPSQAFITWRVKFHFSDGTGAPPGMIFILDDIGGGALAFINTGVIWNTGVYTELKVQFDPALGQVRYFYGGALIHTGVIYAGNVVEQVGSVNDNFQLGGETADFDDIVLIDTPTDPTNANIKSWGRIKKAYR
jgi:hypothetical protein